MHTDVLWVQIMQSSSSLKEEMVLEGKKGKQTTLKMSIYVLFFNTFQTRREWVKLREESDEKISACNTLIKMKKKNSGHLLFFNPFVLQKKCRENGFHSLKNF